MSVNLVTGYAGEAHVTAMDAGNFHAGLTGKGKYVFDTGNKFAHEIVSNNLIRIADGDLIDQGRHIRIPYGDYEECVIDNGLQSLKRNDLIVMRYSKDSNTNVETAGIIVIKGTSSETPADPAYESGDIFAGDLTDDTPLYRVRLDGLNIEGVDCLFGDTLLSISKLSEALQGISSEFSELATRITSFENTKSEIVSSALGKAVNMLTSNTWAEIVGKIKWVKNLSADTPIKLSSANTTRVVKGDGVYIGDNTDGVKRITIRYSGDTALIAGNTLLGAPASEFGTAAAANVLTGQTFTSQNGVKVSGTMPNRSTLGWAPNGPETYAVPAGYYTGGWLNAKPAYEAGIAYADSRVNTSSVSYDAGYAAGLKEGRTSAAATEEEPSISVVSIEGDTE